MSALPLCPDPITAAREDEMQAAILRAHREQQLAAGRARLLDARLKTPVRRMLAAARYDRTAQHCDYCGGRGHLDGHECTRCRS